VTPGLAGVDLQNRVVGTVTVKSHDEASNVKEPAFVLRLEIRNLEAPDI